MISDENRDLINFLKLKYITQDEFDILFCSKNDWYTLNNTTGKKVWASSRINNKQKEFWKVINKIKLLFEDKKLNFKYSRNNYNFSFIHFPPITIDNSKLLGVYSDNPIIKFIKNKNNINFNKATFYGDIIINDSFFDISIKFKGCKFLGKLDLRNVTFNCVTIFKDAKFFDDTTFRGVSFNEWTSFNTITSYKKLNFTYSRTKDLIDFSNSKIYSIDLEHTRFTNASFLHIKGLDKNSKVIALSKSNFSNKESARLIKTHFEKENNITESNKYFQIEQDLYIEQLKREQPKDTNKWKNLFVLYLNKYISNFGIDWVRPLLVMFIFGYIASLGYAFLQEGTESINFTNSKFLLLGAFLYSLLIYYFYHKKLWIAFISSMIVFSSLLLGYSHLREISNDISKLINPLNIFKPTANYFENIAIYGMLVKLGMSVLIYQFIMAFRQNTRRK